MVRRKCNSNTATNNNLMAFNVVRRADDFDQVRRKIRRPFLQRLIPR